MAITLASLSDWVSSGLASFRVRFPTRRLDTESFLGGTARAVAMMILGFTKSVLDADNDAVPSLRSSTAALDLWASTIGVPSNNPSSRYGRNLAVPATGGQGIPAGGAGITIPDGTQLTDQSGQTIFQLSGAITTNGPPNTVGAKIIAVTPGVVGNLPAGSVLTWITPPPGINPNVTLTTGLGGGLDLESNLSLLLRIWFRWQNPPRGGDAADFRFWCENYQVGLVLPGLVVRAYVYPLRGGAGTVHMVITGGGSGLSRLLTMAIQTQVQAWIELVRPATSKAVVLLPTMVGAVLRVRPVPSSPRYGYDWTDNNASLPIVNAVMAGGTSITVNANVTTDPRYATLVAAVNAGLKPRLAVQTVNSVLPVIVQVTGYTNVAQSVLTLAAPAVSPVDNLTQVPLAPGDQCWAGGPLTLPVAMAVLAAANGLGPSKQSGYADPGDIWDDTLRYEVLAQVALDTLDPGDQRTKMVADVAALPTINGAAANLQAQDVLFAGTPQLLYASQVVVTA